MRHVPLILAFCVACCLPAGGSLEAGESKYDKIMTEMKTCMRRAFNGEMLYMISANKNGNLPSKPSAKYKALMFDPKLRKFLSKGFYEIRLKEMGPRHWKIMIVGLKKPVKGFAMIREMKCKGEDCREVGTLQKGSNIPIATDAVPFK